MLGWVADLLVVVGARPNFMKADAVLRAAGPAGLSCSLLHTGQHYDHELSRVFFDELELPEPDTYLGVGSGTHTEQTARIMLAFEDELRRVDPRVVVVVGDVNSTLACALVAAKEHYPVAHVEAGLRSFDERMPEEINRRLCDHVSTYLYTPSRDANDNLAREGIPPDRIVFVGNTMIDTLFRLREKARATPGATEVELEPSGYALATFHRPENVDEPRYLAGLLTALAEIGSELPVVFPIHPRTRARIGEFGLDNLIADARGVRAGEPLGYLDFVGLLSDARLVITDSGGIQEEATALGIPCFTVRDRTERPVTVTAGTNTVVGRNPERLVLEVGKALSEPKPPARLPERWDGRAGERIVAHLRADLELRAAGRLDQPSKAQRRSAAGTH
jgi:UDP-N-acetylglucosamine 2-epimerase (non-hydrolysing)